MSAKSPKFMESRAEPADRGAPPKRRSLEWVREVLGRQIRLERDRKLKRVASPEAKRGPSEPEVALPLIMQQCAEIGARLLIHDPATQPVRHLFILHDELRNGGWARVELLPLKVIDRALTEAEILDCAEPSPLLTTIVEELRGQKAAAEARAAREAAEAEWEVPQVPEVSDTNFDEYELMERSWAGTIPAGLEIPARDTTM
ncbi:MAG TPA: hypothetical protein VH041_06545 [Caldimonas sp.]|jgi:hypothetical protein|nr:hypothetical protein [Caldimonas sp.]HEX4233948.1 hypothetical protein [Caldimonas sp.]